MELRGVIYNFFMALTKQDLGAIESLLNKKFVAYQDAVIEAVDFKFQNIEKEMSELRSEIRRLTTTLDNFVKMITDYKDEFIILKTEVDQIKKVLKEKLGVDILAQG